MCCFCKASSSTQRKKNPSVLGRKVAEVFIAVVGMCVGMGGWAVGVGVVAVVLNQNSIFYPFYSKGHQLSMEKD